MRHPLNPGYRITSNFSSGHPGTDYAPKVPGTTGVGCYAPERCYVERSGYRPFPLKEGNYLILRGLTSGKYYYFGHFASKNVGAGQHIGEGTLIGILGKTGRASGIHTHCEVRSELGGGVRVNPETFFKKSPAPAPPSGAKVFLPASVDRWRIYDVNVPPVAGREKGFLRPSKYPPGLTYQILAWHDAGTTVEIQSPAFGRSKIYVKGTVAQFK